MSMSDCPKCWDTPCNCGYEYRRHWTPDRLRSHIKTLQWVLACMEAEAAGGVVPDDEHRSWARWQAKVAKEAAEQELNTARWANYKLPTRAKP